MRELSVLFNGPMVRAILEGRKNQTRRPLRNQPEGDHFILSRKQGRKIVANIRDGVIMWIPYGGAPEQPMPMEEIAKYLPYAVGDRMYVRESFYQSPMTGEIAYKADGFVQGWQPRPSIHMPKRAARIWLPVTDVRVERLQDISPEDCWQEGIVIAWPTKDETKERATEIIRDAFIDLWDAQYGKTKYAWKNNPWVSVTEFQRSQG